MSSTGHVTHETGPDQQKRLDAGGKARIFAFLRFSRGGKASHQITPTKGAREEAGGSAEVSAVGMEGKDKGKASLWSKLFPCLYAKSVE